MDQLNMLSLAFEIRTDVAAKWSVNALLLGYALIFKKKSSKSSEYDWTEALDQLWLVKVQQELSANKFCL